MGRRNQQNFITRLFFRVVYLLLFSVLALSLYVGFQFHQFQNLPIQLQQKEAVFSIQRGQSIRTVAQNLVQKGYIKDSLMFIVLARMNGQETQIRAGEYRLNDHLTPKDLLTLFSQGSSINYSFTIIEGWTFRQMLQELKKDQILEHTIGNDIDSVMTRINNSEQHPEGRFMPDTYHYPRGTTDIDFLKRSYQTMQQYLQTAWENRADNLPLKSPYEALILASIIEKETGVTYEMPLISAAFITRLNKGMKLQTDPTIIYGLGDSFDGDIRYRDLKKDTPYNTYIHRGLPPTPIALPGREAIDAALHPADSDAIYFVSKGDGTHHFSKTLKEHNAAVSKYQLKGRQPKRKPDPG